MKRGSILFASLMVGSIAYGKDQPATAHADLINSQGEKIGTAKLTQSRKGVDIAIDASQLPPGVHGFHFHTAGKCDPPDFKTAEGHFNPEGKKHGLKNPDGPHAGDMQNVTGVRSVRIFETVLLSFGIEVSLRCFEIGRIAFPRRVKMETMDPGRKLGGIDGNVYPLSTLRELSRTDLLALRIDQVSVGRRRLILSIRNATDHQRGE